MTIHDFRKDPAPTVISADIAIVGAGAAGITVAHALRDSGLSICLLESGGHEPDPETQALYEMEYVGYPHREGYHPRIRMLGGSTSIWAGRSMALQAIDLDRPTVAEQVQWPISLDEISRHFRPAASYLRLPGINNFQLESHRSRLTSAEKLLLESGDLAPALSLWAIKPQRFGNTFQKDLKAAQTVQLWINASVTGLILDDDQRRLQALEIASLDGRRGRVEAKTFVLACGGIETARLLLNTPGAHGDSLGNGSGHLGRYFMDHPRTVFGRAELEPHVDLRLSRGMPIPGGKVQLGFRVRDEAIREEGLLNHYCTLEEETSGYVQQTYQPFVEVMKVMMRKGHSGSRFNIAKALKAKSTEGFVYLLSPKEIMPHWAYRLLYALRRRLPRQPRARRYALVYFCEQPPQAESRISLSDQTDRFGMRRVQFDWRIDPAVEKDIVKLQSRIDEVLRSNGLGHVKEGEQPVRYTDASHHLGTTRMSARSEGGVVDADCRLHEVDNLYIAGSSVFPTGGHANPTLTVVALALRLSDHLRKVLKQRTA